MVSQSQSTRLSEAVENPTQLDSDTPASFIFGLFAKLLWAATLPNGKQQLDRVAVNQKAKSWDWRETARSSPDA